MIVVKSIQHHLNIFADHEIIWATTEQSVLIISDSATRRVLHDIIFKIKLIYEKPVDIVAG